MRLRYTRPALADLEGVLAGIAVESPRAARRVQARLKAVTALLVKYPGIGRRTDDARIRRMPVLPTPYLVFYEPTDDEIIIHAVRHGARDPATMPGAQ